MNFVSIPKVASTSIGSVLGHDGMPRRASTLPRPRFAFVRHPLDRLVSMWSFASQPEFLPLMGGAPLTFDEFIRANIVNELTRPQTHWLDAPVDFIGRFERLHDDWRRISDTPLPHLNGTDHADWRSYYTPETLEIACERYTDDFRGLGYERLLRQ